MAGIKLETMTVNPGDPITSELMSSIVSNINLIGNLSNSTTAGDTSVSSQIIESNMTKVNCKTDSTGQQSVVFTKKFTARPNIVCTVWHTSSKTPALLKYVPTVTSATSTGFTILMQNVGNSKDTGILNIQWIACGN